MRNYPLLSSLLFLSMLLPAVPMTAQEGGIEHVITFDLGLFQISTLSESSEQGETVNAFLVRTPDKNVLIDAGYGQTLFDNIQSLDITKEQINAILLTHLHGNHTGGLLQADKVAFPNAAVYLSQAEYDYWMSDEALLRADALPARKVLAAYKEQLHLFVPDDLGVEQAELLPGFRGIVVDGQTAGQTAYLIESDNELLLAWGELSYADTGNRFLDYVSKNKIPIAGTHTPFPGIGNIIKKAGEGNFSFDPFCLCLGI